MLHSGAGANADTADLFVTFELAPGSEPTENDDIGYTVICADGEDGAVGGAQGDLTWCCISHEDDLSGDDASTPEHGANSCC